MKKIVPILLSVFLLFPLSACSTAPAFRESAGGVTAQRLFADNAPAVNAESPVCLFGDFLLAVQHNRNGSDSIVSIRPDTGKQETLYTHHSEITGIKPIDSQNLCLLTQQNTAGYWQWNPFTGEIRENPFSLAANGEVCKTVPYFTPDAVYIAAWIGREPGTEPTVSLFRLDSQGNGVPVIPVCTQFQFTDDGILYDKDQKAVLLTWDGKETEYPDIHPDLVSALLWGTRLISVQKGYYEITDVPTSEILYQSAQAVPENSPGFSGGICLGGDALYAVDGQGILRLPLDGSEAAYISEAMPAALVLLDGTLYYEWENTVYALRPDTGEKTAVC